MKFEKPNKRMTLRERLTYTEKCTRDLIEHLHGDLLAVLAEFRDLTRPVRRKSHYPTRTAIGNSLKNLATSGEETMLMCEFLLEELKYIGDSAQREIDSR